mgnify:CR=1 FL=1
MYQDTINHFGEYAEKKVALLKSNPAALFIGAMMAGVYVGLGIILILSVGGVAEHSYQKLVMGLSFGVALTLVVFAGAELFTGYTMYMMFGWLQRRLCWRHILSVWAVVWLGNLAGAVLLVGLFYAGGGGNLAGEAAPLLHKIAEYKMNSTPFALLAKGALCNWLVCLSLWMSARTRSDAAKAIAIFWALFTFISSGYEHSVANMTLLSLSLVFDHPDSISLVGMLNNLFWVTLGNTIGGSIFMGLGYWHYSAKKCPVFEKDKKVVACCDEEPQAVN